MILGIATNEMQRQLFSPITTTLTSFPITPPLTHPLSLPKRRRLLTDSYQDHAYMRSNWDIPTPRRSHG